MFIDFPAMVSQWVEFAGIFFEKMRSCQKDVRSFLTKAITIRVFDIFISTKSLHEPKPNGQMCEV